MITSGRVSINMRSKIYQSSVFSDALIDRKAYLGLSLSNRITNSDSILKSIFEWTSRKINSFDIVIGDYSHRHNLQDLEGLDVSAAKSLAIAQGREVSLRICGILHNLGLTQVTTHLASEICADPTFNTHLFAKESLYDSCPSFAHQIDEAAQTFLKRLAPNRMSDNIALEHSRAYQFEELAMFELLVLEGYTVILYPGRQLPVMKAIVTGELRGILPILENMVLIEIQTGSIK